MTENEIRLLNIIQDRFKVPERTDGVNILMTLPELMAELNAIWPQDGNWSLDDLSKVVVHMDLPYIINDYRQQIFLLVRSSVV